MSLGSVGEISKVLSPVLGEQVGRLVFSMGVLGAVMIAAIVSSLALAGPWGAGEIAAYRRSLERRPLDAGCFYGGYAACSIGAAAMVWSVRDLVWLNISAQVLNVFLLPLVIGILVALSAKALPEPLRPRRWYLSGLIAISAAVSVLGLVGAISALS